MFQALLTRPLGVLAQGRRSYSLMSAVAKSASPCIAITWTQRATSVGLRRDCVVHSRRRHARQPPHAPLANSAPPQRPGRPHHLTTGAASSRRVATPTPCRRLLPPSAPTLTTAEAASRAGGTILSFIDLEAASVEVLAVHGHDRCLGVGIGAHRHEREPARTPALAVAGDRDLPNRTSVGSKRVQILFRGR